MATEVAALVARLEADTRDFQKGLKGAEKRLQGLEREGQKTRKGLGQTDKATQGLTKTVKGFGLAVAGSFAAKAVLDFAKSTISAASDLGESINAVEVTFGDAAEGIKDLGIEAATAVGLSNAEFNTLAVGFAAFVDKIAEGGGDVVGVMEELTGRAADFASVMNIDVAEAATIFRSGLAGETEPLRKFGIDLSAAAVTAEALASGLAETSSELTEQDKILARYNLLMEQTEKTAGDFENTSGSLANATRILAATFENAQAAIGDALIPTIEKLIPLAQKGIDLIIGWSIWLGRLTGAIDLVDASVRRAKLGIDDEATAIEFLFEAMRKLDLEFGGIDEKAPLGDLFANLISENALQVDKLSKRFDNLAETFGLTAEDAEFMRENAEELAEEFKTTADEVLLLADLLDEDLAEAMQNVAAKEGIKLLENTQDIRDAVLDGKDAVTDLAESEEVLAKKHDLATRAAERNKVALQNNATAMRDLRSAFLEAADPIFAVKQALNRASDAQEIYDEFLAEGTLLTSEGIDAAFDLAAANTDLEESFRALAGGDVQKGIEQIARQLGISVDAAREFLVEAGIIEGLDVEVTIQLNLEKGQFLRDLNDIPVIPGAVLRPINPGNITQRHSGGVIPGPPGADVPAILQAGETVRTVSQERALQGGGGTTVIVQGFVGSELQLAAQIDKLLTRRSKTSKLGF